MIHLTCDECKTVYQLEGALLGAHGRTVRCGQCKRTWFQEALEDKDAPQTPAIEPILEPAPPPAEDAPDWLRADEPPAEELDFRLSDKPALAEDDIFSGGALKPFTPVNMPVMTHRPFGMGAVQFGLCAFLLPAFVTVLVLLVLRGPLMRHAPVMEALYRPIGLGAAAPGEGLALYDVVAQNKNETLGITAQLKNTTDEKMDWPRFSVTAQDAQGAILKRWDSADAGKGASIAAGMSLPLVLSFEGAPHAVARVQITAVP